MQLGTFVERSSPSLQQRCFRQCGLSPRLDFSQNPQSVLQLQHFPRQGTHRRHLREQTLQITYLGKLVFEKIGSFPVLDQRLHIIETFLQLFLVLQRQAYHAPQQTRTHRRGGLVQYGPQGILGLLGIVHRCGRRLQKLQIAQGKSVHPDIPALYNLLQGGYMRGFFMPAFNQIMQAGSSRYLGCHHIFHPEAFQGIGLEMFQQKLASKVGLEHPVLKNSNIITIAEKTEKLVPVIPRHHNLRRLEIVNQLMDIFHIALGHKEFPGADIQERNAHLLRRLGLFLGSRLPERSAPSRWTCLAWIQTAEEIVLPVFQKAVIERNAWRNQFCDPSLYQLFGQLRIFQLLANGHLAPGTDQLVQISFQRVVRESSQLDKRMRTIGLASQNDIQHLRSENGIFPKGLVKVSDPKKEHSIRMLLLDFVVLPHQRSFHHFAISPLDSFFRGIFVALNLGIRLPFRLNIHKLFILYFL